MFIVLLRFYRRYKCCPTEVDRALDVLQYSNVIIIRGPSPETRGQTKQRGSYTRGTTHTNSTGPCFFLVISIIRNILLCTYVLACLIGLA